MANLQRQGQFHYPGNRYSSNDDNIKALASWRATEDNEPTSALLSDQTIWATIARIVRQSGA
jgi:hypothetical protein